MAAVTLRDRVRPGVLALLSLQHRRDGDERGYGFNGLRPLGSEGVARLVERNLHFASRLHASARALAAGVRLGPSARASDRTWTLNSGSGGAPLNLRL